MRSREAWSGVQAMYFLKLFESQSTLRPRLGAFSCLEGSGALLTNPLSTEMLCCLVQPHRCGGHVLQLPRRAVPLQRSP